MKIEHWKCRADHPDEQLNYRNLLGACPEDMGNRVASSTATHGRGTEILNGILLSQRIALRPASGMNRMARYMRMTRISMSSSTTC